MDSQFGEIQWEDVTRLMWVGLDEISLKKGHLALWESSQGGCEDSDASFWGGADRKKGTVKTFLRVIPQRCATRSTPISDYVGRVCE